MKFFKFSYVDHRQNTCHKFLKLDAGNTGNDLFPNLSAVGREKRKQVVTANKKKIHVTNLSRKTQAHYLTHFLLQTMILKVFFIQGNGLAHVSYVDPTKLMFSIGIEIS